VDNRDGAHRDLVLAIENVFSFDNSADFGIHLGFSRRF
jgi:hypothetical protein